MWNHCRIYTICKCTGNIHQDTPLSGALKKVSIFKDWNGSIFSNHNEIKLELNSNKISRKSPNILELNNTFLNNMCIRKLQGKLENISKLCWENTACQNVCDVAKATCRRKFIKLHAYIKKEKRAKNSNPFLF